MPSRKTRHSFAALMVTFGLLLTAFSGSATAAGPAAATITSCQATQLTVAGRTHRVDRRAGTDERPLLRLAGVDDPRPLRGELLLVEDELGEGEWLASDLVGLTVPDVGEVAAVIDSPSCSLLELTDGTLIPFISDAVTEIDLDAGEIRVNREFLG